MKRNLPVGVSDFKKVREKYYFVDKTDFIRQLIDKPNEVTLFTRPRRFGKTLTMSMLDYFFSIDKANISKKLFQGMAIEQAGIKYMQERGKHPVIFISFKECCEVSWEEMYEQLTVQIQYEFQKHRYLLDGDTLRPEEKDLVKRFITRKADVVEYKRSLWYLSMYLSRYFGVNTIILIDEYDAPLQYAYTNGFYDRAINFFKRLFSAVLKENDFLDFAVLTGVLRIAKESIFSGLNNLAVYSVLERTYSDVFGFTSVEVAKMAEDLHGKEKISEIKQWYDGYTFGQTEIYNPWSVIQYFSENCIPAPYWISTSDNGILRQLLHNTTPQQIEALQELLQGNSVATSLNPNVIYRTLQAEPQSLYTILLTTGYLTADTAVKYADNRYRLRIPNEEIKRVYRLEILDTLAHGLDSNTFENLFDYLFTGRAEQFESQLQILLIQFVSSYDTANHESFYHGFMLGMTALFLTKEYDTESNRESGYGRFDLAVFPLQAGKAGVIMEFKVADSEQQLEAKAQEALQQIESKAYITEFQKRNVQHVWKYGISFCGKHVKIVQSV